jgi:hypothetical protein
LRQGKPGFEFVRYEDLLANPEKELTRLAAAVGIAPTPERIARAVHLSSVSRMQSLEKKQSKDWVVTKGTRQDIPFVREAKAGGWRGKLSPQAVAAIENAWGTTMKEVGYELVTDRELAKS